MSERSLANGAAQTVRDRSEPAAAAPATVVPPAHLPPVPATPPPPSVPPASSLPPRVSVPVAVHPSHAPPEATTVDEADALDDGLSHWHGWWEHMPSWLTSMVVHLTLVLVLALLTTVPMLRPYGSSSSSTIVSTEPGDGGDAEELTTSSPLGSPDLPISEAPASPSPEQMPEFTSAAQLATAIGPIVPSMEDSLKLGSARGGATNIGEGLGLAGGGGVPGGAFGLRMGGDRSTKLRGDGLTPESEYAVEQALRWLAEHQFSDGSWSFAHQQSPKCHGACANPGFTPGKIAATALALLPFLGNGQTQVHGQHRRTVDAGLRFLVRSAEIQGDRASLWEDGGQMYGHGLAAIVLCEAYGMTHDAFLRQAAQGSVNYIGDAQDPRGGGWRYRPLEPGDTSVLGWQLMALKSAEMAYLHVPPGAMRKAGYFLDHVQADRGATYGYQDPDNRRPATTAIGLLCRMYLGWEHDHEPLVRGVQVLSQLGPSTDTTRMRNNMYYNYYATQVMHHYGGYPWQRWNTVMRDYLVQTQDKGGHQTGSWYLPGSDNGAPAGGRLYCTAMAAMTLEVYYRHMPLYRNQSVRPQ